MQISDLKAKVSRQLEEAIGRYNAAKADVEKLQFALSTLMDVTEPLPPPPPVDVLTTLTTAAAPVRSRRPLLTRQNGGYGKIQTLVLDVIAELEKDGVMPFSAATVKARLPVLLRPTTLTSALTKLRERGLITREPHKLGTWRVVDQPAADTTH